MQTSITPTRIPSRPARGDNRKLFKRDRDQARRIRRAAKFGTLAILAGMTIHSAQAAEGVSPTNLSDEQVHAALDYSAAQYGGACPCPYTIKANGKPCGKASAWSRPGGVVVLCFPEDVTDATLAELVRAGFKL